MAVVLEESTLVENEVDIFAKNFVSEMKKMEGLARPPLYREKPGAHPTPVEKRSPYWQPVDDQS